MKQYITRKWYRIAGIVLFIIVCPLAMQAQQIKRETRPGTEPEPVPRVHNLKVLDEHKDKNGNIVRVVQYEQGLMKITETIIKPSINSHMSNAAIKADTMKKDSVTIVISKSHYSLQVYYRRQMIRTYHAVFGPRPMEDKLVEGDRCTPEGWFKIKSKNAASRYDKFMLLNYPNDSSYAHFNKLKASGKLPASARIGGDVGIHGIWPGGDDMIDMGIGWTDGCIALRNKDVEELFTFVGVGTRVYIKK